MIVIVHKNLKIIVLLSSIMLIIATEADPQQKGVNVALETSFLVDPKVYKYSVNHIRRILDKLITDLDPQKPRDHSGRRDADYTDDLENETDTVSSIKNLLRAMKDVGQNILMSGIGDAVNNINVQVVTEPSKSKYEERTAISEEVKDPQNPRGRFRAQNMRRDTKQDREDSLENIIKKTDVGTAVKDAFDFVKNVGQTFVSSGNKIAEAVSNIHVQVVTETNKPRHKGEPISEELQEKYQHKRSKKDIIGIISNSINKWMRRYPEEMKNILNKTVDSENPFFDTFSRRMNNYYSQNDINKLKKLLKKFKRHIENNQDTTQIVSDLLNNAVFTKYGSLNDTTKMALIEDLKMCSKLILSDGVLKGVNEHLDVLTRRYMPKNNIETGEIRSIDDMTYTNLRRTIDNKLRETREKNKKTKKYRNLDHELMVDSAEFLRKSARE